MAAEDSDKASVNVTTEPVTDQQGTDTCPSKTLFYPPMYMQRLRFVADFIAANAISSVLDAGCGQEVRLLGWVKRLNCLHSFIGLDLEHERFRAYNHVQLGDILTKRTCELRAKLVEGSITEPIDQWQLKQLPQVDAVVMIEVIEHIEPCLIDQLSKNIFYVIRPKFILITTPNRDFNLMFSTMPYGKFRHPDHKFEWSRQEFRIWATGKAARYGYELVEITGVGQMKDRDCSQVGYCSQIAIFNRSAAPTSTPTVDIDPNIPNPAPDTSIIPIQYDTVEVSGLIGCDEDTGKLEEESKSTQWKLIREFTFPGVSRFTRFARCLSACMATLLHRIHRSSSSSHIGDTSRFEDCMSEDEKTNETDQHDIHFDIMRIDEEEDDPEDCQRWIPTNVLHGGELGQLSKFAMLALISLQPDRFVLSSDLEFVKATDI